MTKDEEIVLRARLGTWATAGQIDAPAMWERVTAFVDALVATAVAAERERCARQIENDGFGETADGKALLLKSANGLRACAKTTPGGE